MITIKEVTDKYLGMSHHLGEFDCLTIVVEIYEMLGITIKHPAYNVEKNWALCGEDWFDKYHSGWKKVNDYSPFDVVAFVNGKGVIFHIGVMLDNGRFIHNQGGPGVVISRISDQIWKKRFAGFYRHNKRK